VSAEDPGSEENLYDSLELHSPRTRDFLYSVPGSGGDAQVLQQSSKPAGEDRRFSSEGLHLFSISVQLLRFGIARGEVVLHQSYPLYRGPRVVALPLANPEQLGSQEPLALSRRVPPLKLPLVVCQAGILEAAARSEVPSDRQVDSRCSCVRCGGYEPSII
jgi:hypothetical protein